MKETIIGEIRSQPLQHAEKWETQVDHDGFESWIYLNKVWPPGKVKITIETQSYTEKANKNDK